MSAHSARAVTSSSHSAVWSTSSPQPVIDRHLVNLSASSDETNACTRPVKSHIAMLSDRIDSPIPCRVWWRAGRNSVPEVIDAVHCACALFEERHQSPAYIVRDFIACWRSVTYEWGPRSTLRQTVDVINIGRKETRLHRSRRMYTRCRFADISTARGRFIHTGDVVDIEMNRCLRRWNQLPACRRLYLYTCSILEQYVYIYIYIYVCVCVCVLGVLIWKLRTELVYCTSVVELSIFNSNESRDLNHQLKLKLYIVKFTVFEVHTTSRKLL